MTTIRISDCQTVEMKTDLTGNNNTGNVIWNVELPQLTSDECLPVIGSSSSILTNLDAEKSLHNLEVGQNMEFIVLQDNEKLPQFQTSTNFFVVKRNIKQLESIDGATVLTAITRDVDDSYFFCSLCPFFCLQEKRLSDHMETAHKNGETMKIIKYKCPGCENIFFQKLSLKAHLINDHMVLSSDLTKIVTNVIKKLANNRKDLEIVINSKAETLNCKNEIDTKFNNKLPSLHTEKIIEGDELNNGELPNNSNESLPDISQTLDNLSNLNTSLVVNLPTIDILPCNSEKMFNNFVKKRNSSTISKLLDRKLHRCTLSGCNVRLQNMEKLNYHIKCHSDTTFKCPECNEAFAFWKPLTGHLWRQHKIDMELFSCDKCDYKTYSLGKLNNIHKLIHNDAKPYICNLCPRAFKNSKQLRNHKTLHKQKTQKNNSVMCEICSKYFSNRRQLRVHTDSVHKKIKPFLCTYCGYKGATKSALRMHTRQHTGEKPFACDTCSYTTADHNSLRRHKLRHSGEMPYKCIHCDYACIQSSTYKVHLKTKHPGLEQDLLYSCTECLFRTINKSMFKTHVSTMHNNTTLT
ncbi:zinc finger protein 492-like isoform X2 [Onthophagus taurus]|nr:zinc finger protein 879-like isoform X2 [Onthophagus taurus]XP_022907335.1 zinc finger protein 879-like isoform X2 [Onthophagus taurus]